MYVRSMSTGPWTVLIDLTYMTGLRTRRTTGRPSCPFLPETAASPARQRRMRSRTAVVGAGRRAAAYEHGDKPDDRLSPRPNDVPAHRHGPLATHCALQRPALVERRQGSEGTGAGRDARCRRSPRPAHATLAEGPPCIPRRGGPFFVSPSRSRCRRYRGRGVSRTRDHHAVLGAAPAPWSSAHLRSRGGGPL